VVSRGQACLAGTLISRSIGPQNASLRNIIERLWRYRATDRLCPPHWRHPVRAAPKNASGVRLSTLGSICIVSQFRSLDEIRCRKSVSLPLKCQIQRITCISFLRSLMPHSNHETSSRAASWA
jgi:hypothetical protein